MFGVRVKIDADEGEAFQIAVILTHPSLQRRPPPTEALPIVRFPYVREIQQFGDRTVWVHRARNHSDFYTWYVLDAPWQMCLAPGPWNSSS
jgi:hypothetical protein